MDFVRILDQNGFQQGYRISVLRFGYWIAAFSFNSKVIHIDIVDKSTINSFLIFGFYRFFRICTNFTG